MSKYTDAERLDFLDEFSDSVYCNVQLHKDIVDRNIHSLRDAIDETIDRYKEGFKQPCTSQKTVR